MDGIRYFTKFQRKSATGEMAAQLLEAEEHIDVTEMLPKVTTPTLILHRKGDRACSVQKMGTLFRCCFICDNIVNLPGTDSRAMFYSYFSAPDLPEPVPRLG